MEHEKARELLALVDPRLAEANDGGDRSAVWGVCADQLQTTLRALGIERES